MDIRSEGTLVKVRVTDEDGDELKMFAIRDSGSNTKECWIPSNDGDTFQITWEAKAPVRRYKNFDLRAIPYLDGLKMEEGILTASQRGNGEFGCLGGQQVDVNVSCPFQFGRLNITDDLALERYRIHPSDLNTIKVVVEWGRAVVRALSPEDLDQATFDPPPDRGLIHESSVKHGNYSAAIIGDPVATKASTCTHTYRFRRDTELDRFTFIFRYASMDWLRNHGITPPPKRPRRAPSHTPDYIDVDAFDFVVKTEPDEVGIVPHPSLQAVFLDSDEEIELLGYKASSGTQRTQVKVEEVNIPPKIEPED